MKSLVRWLLRIAAVAAVLAVLMSLTVGLIVEKYFPRGVAELDRRLPQWTLRSEGLVRGWWTSEATLIAQDNGGNTVWRYRESLAHGPLLHQGANLGWIGGQGTLETPDRRTLAGLKWRLSPAMNLFADLDLSPAGEPGGNAQLQISEWFSQAEIGVQELSLRTPDGLALQGWSGSVWAALGEGRIRAHGALAGESLDWPGAAVRGAELGVTLDGEGELLELGVEIKAREAQLDQIYRHGRVEVRLARLHRPTLEQIIDSTVRVLQAGLAAPLRNQQLSENLLLGVPGLLQHQPRIDLSGFELDSPRGRLAGHAAAALVEAPAAGYLSDPAKLLQVLALDWELSVAPELARHWLRLRLQGRDIPGDQVELAIEEALERLRLDGMLIPKDEELSSRGELRNRKLVVNGQTIELLGL